MKQLVNKYGAQKWKSIAEKLEGRSGRSDRLVSLVVCFLCLFSYLVLFLKEIKLVAPPYNVIKDCVGFVAEIICILEPYYPGFVIFFILFNYALFV